ncbi:hypothetical protein CEXT_222121 [Caerostris extrusa]|uniref:Uncharacterized protein n=1 Tax=Caerostris extrusa TaxID=172846 RepID=A0AAV4MSI2_CAEEX|nr:hypothetical protein CEXT_222121 [Caerostris extrusa]
MEAINAGNKWYADAICKSFRCRNATAVKYFATKATTSTIFIAQFCTSLPSRKSISIPIASISLHQQPSDDKLILQEQILPHVQQSATVKYRPPTLQGMDEFNGKARDLLFPGHLLWRAVRRAH